MGKKYQPDKERAQAIQNALARKGSWDDIERFDEVQDPYELGLSIWSTKIPVEGKDNEFTSGWVHKSFTFSPQGTSKAQLDHYNANTDDELDRIEWIDEHSHYSTDPNSNGYRGKQADGFRTKLFDTMHTENAKAVDWDGINEFLTTHGYSNVDGSLQDVHFAAHNGIGFDYPMMERLFTTGKNKDTSIGLFRNLYNKARGTGKKRKLNNLLHDTAAEMLKLWAGTDRYMIDAKTRKGSGIQNSPSTENGENFWGGVLQFPSGCTMDNFRASLQGAYHSENDNPLVQAFNDPETREELFESLGIAADMKDISSKDSRHLFNEFMTLAAHSGVADTAFGVMGVLPMLTSEIELDWDNETDVQNYYKGNPFWVGVDGAAYTPTSFHTAAIAAIPDNEEKLKRKPRSVAPSAQLTFDTGDDSDTGDTGVEGYTGVEGETAEERAIRLEEAAREAGRAPGYDQDSAIGTVEKPVTNSVVEHIKNNVYHPSKKDFPLAIQELIGENPIDLFKWEGDQDDTDDGRIIVTIPLGNSRIAFRGSYFDEGGNRNTTLQSFEPMLGIAKSGTPSDNNDIKDRAVSAYITRLFTAKTLTGDSYPGPLASLGKAISDTLMSNLPKLQKRTAGFPLFGMTEANKRINTPASHSYNLTMENPEASYRDHMRENSVDYQKAALDAVDKVANGYEGEDGSTGILPWNMSHALVSMLLADPLRGSEAFEALNLIDPKTGKVKEDWYNSDEQMREFYSAFRTYGVETTPTKGDYKDGLFDYDDSKPQTLGINYAQLFDDYFRGIFPPGIHNKQLMKNPSGENSSIAEQLANYMVLRHRVENLPRPEGMTEEQVALNIINDMYGGDPPMEMDDHSEIYDVKELEDISTGDLDRYGPTLNSSTAAQDLVKNGDPTDMPSTVIEQVPQEDVKTAEAKSSYRRSINSKKAAGEKLTRTDHNMLIADLTEAYGSPFTSWHNITGPRVDYNNQETIDLLFPDRQKATTNDGVQALIDGALEEYSQDPTSLLRELEWIRENHPDWIDQEKMQTALRDNDNKSVIGKWINAVKIASDSGADFAEVEQEKLVMNLDGENRFMSNAHREYIRQNPSKEGQGDLVKNPPFEYPKANRTFTLGEKARQLAEGQWKKTGYYNVWRQLRNLKRDNVGRKALEAARQGDVGAIVDMGITTDTQFMEHIGDLPVEGAEQRGLLGTLFEGKKTFRQLHEERNKPDRKTNASNVLRQMQQLQHDMIQHRVPDLTVTDADRKAAQASAKVSLEEQRRFRVSLQEQMDVKNKSTSTTTPPSATFTGGTAGDLSGNAKVDPTTAKDDYVDKDFSKKSKDKLSSLDVLKEYIRSV